MMNPEICASMLSADPTKLGEELLSMETAGIDRIHWDIMDGNYVDSITFGDNIIKAHRKITKLPFDVHLMITNPEKHLETFLNSGADCLIIHPESCLHLHKTISRIKESGKKAGIALNPSSGFEQCKYIIDMIDMLLIMTVNPGKSNQLFINSMLGKIKTINEDTSKKIDICIDGGINISTGKECVKAGATSLVSGSFLFKAKDKKEVIKELRLS